MTVSVFIDGGAGTTGLEIRDRLALRSDVSLVTIDEASRKDPAARATALNDADVVILCLPDDAAREAVALIRNEHTRVIDASTAHRVAPEWVYGLAELEPRQAEQIAAARRVTNPGCYPTGFLALVRPLVRAGLLAPDTPLSVNAVSGYSGGGKTMIAEFEGGEAATAFRPYALALTHKHVAEMTRHAGLSVAPIFQPAVARTYRGMVVQVPIHLSQLARPASLTDLSEVLAEAYDGGRVVRFAHEASSMVRIEDDAGSDRMTLRVVGNQAAGQAVLIATLDNLGKGAAGAAVQNLNIMAGLDPVAGLSL
ncbi:N-acetyl-gamma-glutamyl-phosphate reductase [Sphingomonas sp. DT-51]|uniref:N-acetyl-gamma-glutamyl-phosphate reductase n=1 Tax=Sphingomonas sp. DT-51 TaxID=3396165 RepID=UPI003F19628E